MNDVIRDAFEQSIAVKQESLEVLKDSIMASTNIIVECLLDGGKILVCGNGGSASQSIHLSAELLIRYARERASLPAIALCADIASITAGANDYGYGMVFARQVSGLGAKGDVLVGITTSGKSPNVLAAFSEAKRKGMKTICLNGKDGGKVTSELADVNLVVPSNVTARIQEVHGLIIHIWCDIVEQAIIGEEEKGAAG